jgi:hypothetical protein
MKKKLTTLLLSISFCIAFAQTNTSEVPFVAYWSVGDTYTFNVTTSTQQWKAGIIDTAKDSRNEYRATFTVIDSTETSYTIKWSYKNDIANSYKIPKELTAKFAKYENIDIIYTTSEVGAFTEVVNWQEISKTMTAMFDDIITTLGGKDKKTQDLLATSMQPYKQAYASKEGIEQLLLKEIQLFHYPFGVAFSVKEPLTYDELLPNMFGGSPIKAISKVTVEKVDFENSFCVLKKTMDLNPEDTKRMLVLVFKKMNLDDKKMKEALKTAVFEIKDRNTFAYYFNPGIPQKIETVRETVMQFEGQDIKRVDTTIIEIVVEK